MTRNPNEPITPGVVIEGTLRTEDLLAAFAKELDRVSLTKNSVAEEARVWLEGTTYTGVTRAAMGDDLITDLMDQLDEIAPAHLYFGAHDGDGACFGWWRAVEDAEVEGPPPRETLIDRSV